MVTREAFLAQVEAYLSAANMSATSFGKRALNDPTFVFELREGRSPGLDIVERVERFMSDAPSGSLPAQDSAA